MFWSWNPDLSLPSRRRFILLGCNLILLGLTTWVMASGVSFGGWSAVGLVWWPLFLVLTAQLIYGCSLAATGWWLLRRGGDPARINLTLPPEAVATDLPPTAVVMPIFNEDVGRVFQGLKVMFESLQKTGSGAAFDLFILSDSSDLNTWIAEEKAWFELCKEVGGFGRIFYRKRRLSQHHKSGNLADFCRRWGAKYRYMIVLDADSVMTGAAMVRLTSLMEQNCNAGIIQTGPQLALGRSLFQRMNQFSNRVYGPLFSAGASFWQLDTANFWGHNAIIRLAPFMKFCAMPELPEAGPLGTRILSHDTVEAAFMRRAGYEIWFATDLPGSYEESPPHLLASLQRDRRWCHGNLQHLWFLFTPGLAASSRFNIFQGIMAYASSPLWLLFVLLSPLLLVHGSVSGLVFAWVVCLLLAPKILGALLLLRSPGKLAAFGGPARMLAGTLAETLCSIILAPILMLFYTRFVWSSLTGSLVTWGGQKRTDEEGPSWQELAAAHLGQMILALVWAGAVAWLAPASLPWLAPVLIGPILAIPLSRFLASNRLGERARQRRWFLVPEECEPPHELQQICQLPPPQSPEAFQQREFAANQGLLEAVLDPFVNSMHIHLLHQRASGPIRTRDYLNLLTDRLLLDGPFGLTLREKKTLLCDADSMLAAHQKLWASSASELHDWWRAAFQNYNQSRALQLQRSVGAF